MTLRRRLYTALIASSALVSLLSAAPLLAASGTDGFGYQWLDSDEPGAPGIQSISRLGGGFATPGGAEWSQDVLFPATFQFPFYGVRYDSMRITDNGFITFDLTSGTEPTNKPIPLPGQTPDNELAVLWDDLSPSQIQWGPTQGFYPDDEGYMVNWNGTLGGTVFNVEVQLSSTGEFRYQYWSVTDNGALTIGEESPAGTYGIENLHNGAGPIAGALRNGYVIQFIPPPSPSCDDILQVTCGTTMDATPGAEPPRPASGYSCSGADTLGAWERIIELTVTETSTVQASLTDLGGRDLRLFHLSECDADSCLSGNAANVDMGILAPGSYLLVVDGPTVADNGTFTLNVDCTSISTPAPCDSSVAGDTTGRTTAMDGYGCGPAGADFSGAEQFFDVNLPVAGHLTATVRNNPNLDVFIFPGGSVDPADCLAWGDVTAADYNLAAGDYVVVVDGPPGSEGPFDLDIGCGTKMGCGTPQPTVLDCGVQVSDTISAGPGTAVAYQCDEDAWLGGEHVYRMSLTQPSDVIVQLDSPEGLGVFILNACDEGECLGGNEGATCSASLSAGDYWVVVDSPTDAGGSYDLSVKCVDPDLFERWDACEDPRAGTGGGDTVRSEWNFDDYWYCPDCATHRNNDGTGYNGCAFAMYAVVECGTEMHLPLYDVESGRLRIYDVLNDRYVNLSAETPSWNQSGTEVQWADAGCVDGDPCDANAGTDTRWNNVVNNVYFYNDDDPGVAPTCGVFRMEFLDWGGFVWDLFANCSGDNTPVFDIYDNLCDALNAYTPRAELSVVNPTDDGLCPNPTLNFDIINSGCDSADSFVVNIYEELDTGDQILSKTVPVSQIRPGETINFDELVNLSSSTSPAVVISVDDEGEVFECSEASASGGAVACRPQQGQHSFRFPVCDECVSLPVATANPSKVCSGGSTTLSASGSTIPTCANGVPLEYAWTTTPTVPPVGDPSWTTNQDMLVDPVNADTTWYLWVRCQNDPACVNEDPVSVLVEAHDPPIMTQPTAADIDICTPNVRLDWPAAEFFHDPAAGDGVYNIYRAVSTGDMAADCAQALSNPPVMTGLVGTTSFIDNTTTQNETYVYVVEAEDAEPGNPCLPGGPYQSGATDSVCIAGPVWDEVDRTPPDTDVGNTLRVRKGDPMPLDFTWEDPRDPAETRERFRVYRSDVAPYGPYTIIGDMIDLTGFQDPDAPAVLYFYEVRTVDTCENVAADAFPPDRTPPASCSNLTLSCGTQLEGGTTNCSSDLDSHLCFASRDATGPDRFHSLRFDADYSQVVLSVDAVADLDVYVYDAGFAQCVDWGDQEVTLFDVSSNELVWVVVDGAGGELGAYTLEVECTP